MGKVIPFKKNPVENLSDMQFADIAKDVYDFFDEYTRRDGGVRPISQAKKHAIKSIAKKHGFTIEQAQYFISEMQMRKLDEDLSAK